MTISKIFICILIYVTHLASSTIYKVPVTKEIYYVAHEVGEKNIKPGDVFIYEKGDHTIDQYLGNLSGTPDNRIIIKGEPGAVIKGSTWFEDLKYFTFENLELTTTLWLSNSEGVIIQNLYIHHAWKHGICAMGKNNLIRNNTIKECNQINYLCEGTQGSGQGIGTEKQNDGSLSENITIEDNFVEDNWGEGIDLLYCNNCVARRNKVRNTCGVFYYVDNSQNSLVDGNIGIQTDERFYREGLRTVGLMTGTEAHGNFDIINITFRNNLIINPGKGITFYSERGHYESVHVVHNTFYNCSERSFGYSGSFEPEKVKDNEVSNNVFSGRFAKEDQKEKKSWTAFANVWIGIEPDDYFKPVEDSPGYEGTSIVIEGKISRGVLFNFTGDYCEDPDCYLPKSNILFKKGVKSKYSGDIDFYGMTRNKEHPSIGFAEGSEDKEEEEKEKEKEREKEKEDEREEEKEDSEKEEKKEDKKSNKEENEGISKGVIVAIVIGIIIIGGLSVFLILRAKKKKQQSLNFDNLDKML